MIVVRVELHSAITGVVSEIARMVIGNKESGTRTRGDYDVYTYRGRSHEQFAKGTVHRRAEVLNHPRLAVHVWNLVAKALKAMKYDE